MQSERIEMAKDFETGKDLDQLMDILYVSNRQLELASGASGDAMMLNTSNPGTNCSGGCN